MALSRDREIPCPTAHVQDGLADFESGEAQCRLAISMLSAE